MSRTCAGGLPIPSKCQILMRYGRYPFGFQLRKLPNEQEPQPEPEPEPELRPNLLSTLTATLLLIHWSSCCCSGSSLMRLSNGCLPSASLWLSALACQMCQNSRVRLKLFACHSSDLYASAACAGLLPYAYNASHSPYHSHSHTIPIPVRRLFLPPYHAHVSATLVTCVFITVLSSECPPQRLFFLFSLD